MPCSAAAWVGIFSSLSCAWVMRAVRAARERLLPDVDNYISIFTSCRTIVPYPANYRYNKVLLFLNSDAWSSVLCSEPRCAFYTRAVQCRDLKRGHGETRMLGQTVPPARRGRPGYPLAGAPRSRGLGDMHADAGVA